MKKVFNSIRSIIDKIIILYSVRKININKSGIENSIPFIIINNIKFYGLQTRYNNYKYYLLLSQKIKKKICFKCYQTAADIFVRYIEGGLKFRGPKKELFYKVKEGDVVVEMGAYMGYYTIYLSKKVGASGQVIAIEPMPDNLKYLRQNIHVNNISNVNIIPKGVWNEKTKMTFYREKDDYQSASIKLNHEKKDRITVDADKLDNILKENQIGHIDFMIIQLNGAEPEALCGLNEYKPKNMAIAARYSRGQHKSSKLIKDILIKRDYIVRIVKSNYIFATLKE